MRSIFTGCWKLSLLGLALNACLDAAGDVEGTGGTTATGATGGTTGGTGGTTGGTGGTTGGTSATGGTGGTTGGTGGTTGGTGGSTGGTGGSTGGAAGSGMAGGGAIGTGGSAGAGIGGQIAAGGAPPMGGMGPGGRENGGSAGMAGTGVVVAGMGGSGGSGTGECVKGQTKGKDVAMIGESFIAATHQITQQVESRAKAAGALPQSEKYVDNSVSGTTLANNQIPSQYDKAVSSSGTIKYVLMDGGGNDCLINNNGSAALTAATSLFTNMASKGTEKVVYFFYPDPIGNNFASLKSCLDALRPQMKALCDGLTAPKCYWLDLREIWNGHAEYTSDGIHPTTEGSKATGDAIWDVMTRNCVAQ